MRRERDREKKRKVRRERDIGEESEMRSEEKGRRKER
jgi:hypothetical protein